MNSDVLLANAADLKGLLCGTRTKYLELVNLSQLVNSALNQIAILSCLDWLSKIVAIL